MPETFVQVRFDQAALRRVEQAVAGIPGALPRIVVPSLNRTATWTRTRMARAVAGQLSGKVGETRQRIHIDRAAGQKWQASVLVLDALFPAARWSIPTMQTATGAYVRPSGGAFISLPSGGERAPHGFWARMPSGHVGIFERGKYARRGIAMRRVRKGRVYNVGASMYGGFRRKIWTSQLPVYEMMVRLHQAISFDWLPPLQQAAAAQLVKEMQSRLRWQIERYLRRGR